MRRKWIGNNFLFRHAAGTNVKDLSDVKHISAKTPTCIRGTMSRKNYYWLQWFWLPNHVLEKWIWQRPASVLHDWRSRWDVWFYFQWSLFYHGMVVLWSKYYWLITTNGNNFHFRKIEFICLNFDYSDLLLIFI